MRKYIKLFEEQTTNKTIPDSFDNLVNVLHTARDKSWPDGLAKTILNSTEDTRSLATAIVDWTSKNRNYDPTLLKAAISLIFRESKASSVGVRMHPKEILGAIANLFGGNSSQGYAQIKPDTARQYGIDSTKLFTYSGSLAAAYKILATNYEVAKKYYSGKTVAIYQDNKLVQVSALNDNAALHMAVAAHNAGMGILTKWCTTDIPNIANTCNINDRQPWKDGRVATTNKNQPIPNYFPNKGGVHNYMPKFKIAYDLLATVPNLLSNANMLASMKRALSNEPDNQGMYSVTM
jgi:hypothetical protein